MNKKRDSVQKEMFLLQHYKIYVDTSYNKIYP